MKDSKTDFQSLKAYMKSYIGKPIVDMSNKDNNALFALNNEMAINPLHKRNLKNGMNKNSIHNNADGGLGRTSNTGNSKGCSIYNIFRHNCVKI